MKKIFLSILCVFWISITYVYSAWPYDPCVSCMQWDCCSECETISCEIWQESQNNITNRRNRCSDIPSSEINENTVAYIIEQDGHCCFESINSTYNCNNWGIANTVDERRNRCSDIPSSEINENTVAYIIEQDGHCCFEWWEVSPQCECDNPPTAWQCGSGYVLDWACCVMECSVPTEKRDCNRSWWDWNDSKCKCECNPNKWCCGVQLNVPLPFIGDCIEMTTNNSTAGSRTGSISVNQLNAFPVLVKWISKILVTLIMIFSIIVVIVAWLMMTTSVASESNYKTWIEYLKKVLISLILLWTSWLILKLINPSFFGG